MRTDRQPHLTFYHSSHHCLLNGVLPLNPLKSNMTFARGNRSIPSHAFSSPFLSVLCFKWLHPIKGYRCCSILVQGLSNLQTTFRWESENNPLSLAILSLTCICFCSTQEGSHLVGHVFEREDRMQMHRAAR